MFLRHRSAVYGNIATAIRISACDSEAIQNQGYRQVNADNYVVAIVGFVGGRLGGVVVFVQVARKDRSPSRPVRNGGFCTVTFKSAVNLYIGDKYKGVVAPAMGGGEG